VRRATRERIQCQHLHADSIHGDNILPFRGKRGYCWECKTWLDDLPLGFNGTSPNRRLLTETDAKAVE